MSKTLCLKRAVSEPKSLSEKIDDTQRRYEKPYWEPLSQFARLAEEVGELGRLLNHLYGDKPKKSTEAKQELDEEMADIRYCLLCMANREGIDLDPALKKVIKKAVTRDNDRFKKEVKLE